jgi:hypothetical protein
MTLTEAQWRIPSSDKWRHAVRYKFTFNLRDVQRHRSELLICLYQTIQHHGQERTNTLRVLFCQSREIDLTEQWHPWKANITQLLKKCPPLHRTRSLLRCSLEPVSGLHFFRNRSVHSSLLWHWATVPFTLVDLQLDVQNSYLFTYNTHSLKSSTCFDHYPAHLQEAYVVTVYVQPLVSSRSAGDRLVHRLRKIMLWCTVNQSSRCPIYVVPSGSLTPNFPTKMLKALSPTFMLLIPSVLFSLF